MNKRLIYNRIRTVFMCTLIYFIFDFFVQITGFLEFNSYVGLKSFLPMTFGLLFGLYGTIGSIIAVLFTSFILSTPLTNIVIEIMCITVISIGSWLLWYLKQGSYRVHFRKVIHYVKFIIIVMLLSTIAGLIADKINDGIAFYEIFIWNTFLSILVGIPIMIIYSGIMCLNPILPPYREIDGSRIKIKDDIVCSVSADPNTIGVLNDEIEVIAMKNGISTKRLFEIQNCIEEIYLRIINHFPKTHIDVRVSYDIVFSVEFNYANEEYNPFFISIAEDATDMAGLKLIKHRALLANYFYSFGLNNIHVVI